MDTTNYVPGELEFNDLSNNNVNNGINMTTDDSELCGLNAISKPSKSNPILLEIKELCCKHEYYKASELLGDVSSCKEKTVLLREIIGAIKSAEELVKKSSSTNDRHEQEEYCMQALSICSDCAEAQEKLQFTPPVAPEYIKAEVKGNLINIKWGKIQSQYASYLLVRKANKIPTSPTDGEIICETQNNSVIDTKSEVGVSYFYAVYSKCGNVLSTNGAITTSPVLTVAELDPESISLDIHETHIGFNIEFPKGVECIDIYRDGLLIMHLTAPSFVDIGLNEDQSYTYKFIAIYEDCIHKKYSSIGITKVISPTSPPKPVELNITETEDIATISWNKLEKDILYIYESAKPFNIQENDKLNIADIKDKLLEISGNTYQIQKDFCGVRYYLPVTVRGNIGIAGIEVKLISIVKPPKVSFDKNDTFIRVNWQWQYKWYSIESVHIEAQIDDATVQQYDIDSKTSPEFKIPFKIKDKSIVISIATRFVDGKDIYIGDAISQTFCLKPAKINFKEVKSESIFGLISKDKYSLTLESDSEIPCDIELLISEGSTPMNLVDYISYLTISHREIKPGRALKKEFQYTRIQKGCPLYFRLIAKDRGLAKTIIIVPETRQIK